MFTPNKNGARVTRQLTEDGHLKEKEDLITDGFGAYWPATCPKCGKKMMAVIRPGEAKCLECDD